MLAAASQETSQIQTKEEENAEGAWGSSVEVNEDHSTKVETLDEIYTSSAIDQKDLEIQLLEKQVELDSFRSEKAKEIEDLKDERDDLDK